MRRNTKCGGVSDEKLPPGNGKLAKFLSMVTCLLIGGGAWFQLLRDEDPVPVPAELAGTPGPTVPDEENGLLFLAASLKERKWPLSNSVQYGVLQGHKPWDMAAMKSLLEAAEDLKSRVEPALKLPGWQENEYRDRLSSVGVKWKVEILRAKAMELAEGGRMDEALDWLSVAHALVVRCAEKNQDVSGVMRTAGPLRAIRWSVMLLLSRHPADRKAVVEALRMVRSPAEDFAELRQAVRRTAWSALADLPGKETDGKGGCPAVTELRQLNPAKGIPDWLIRSRYKPDATRNLLLSHFEHLARTGFQEGPEARAAVLALSAKVDAEVKSPVLSVDPNRAGRILAAGIVRDTVHLANIYFVPLEAMRRCQETVLAAKLYAMDHGGEVPESLKKLVPDYLMAIPADPYAVQPVTWMPAARMAWVVGDDGSGKMPEVKAGEFCSPDNKGAWARLP